MLPPITEHEPLHSRSVVVGEQIRGGVKGCTYVLTLGIAYFRPISKDVPKKRE